MDGAPPDPPPRSAARPGRWAGVALIRRLAAPDPDADPRPVALPAAWDEGAAEALAALAPGQGPVLLPRLAEGWIGRAAHRARRLGLEEAEADSLAAALRSLLLSRRGAPGAAMWRGEAAPLRFVLNLPAFLDAAGGFDAEGYAEAVGTAVLALEALSLGKAERLAVGFADLAGWLAGLGLRYGGPEALA
ncbi:MAG: TSCPD domain-containing protein, partial [Acetobacteraceae bacterium]|nr:TSCPD domain-containing protein [Acetobacteraceae bacterium]